MSEIVTLAESLIPMIRELRQRPRMTGASRNRLCARFERVTCVECSSTLAPAHDTHRKSG
jgi:hypothetical protein